MINQLNSQPNKIPKAVFILLFLLVLAAYSNAFQTASHLADYPNVVANSRLHIRGLCFDSLFKTLFATRETCLSASIVAFSGLAISKGRAMDLDMANWSVKV
jgi:hypothetical protein